MRCVNSRHYWSFVHWQVCLWHFTIYTSEVSWRWFRSEKLSFFPWVHAILHMVTPANHHSVSRWGWGWNCGELLSKSSLHRSSPNHFMTFVIRSCSWPHCACCGCSWCCCCSRCRCCYCRCFCFCCFDLADSVETWMLCTLGAFGLTRIPGALYLTLFC